MIEDEINKQDIMGQFATETRRWLEGAIKQRKALIRLNKSQKPAAETERAIATLDSLLKAYTYQSDLFMARFIRQQADNIAMILPGSGSTCARKKNLELNDINYKAAQIIAGSIEFRRLQTKNYLHEKIF